MDNTILEGLMVLQTSTPTWSPQVRFSGGVQATPYFYDSLSAFQVGPSSICLDLPVLTTSHEVRITGEMVSSLDSSKHRDCTKTLIRNSPFTIIAFIFHPIS